LTIDDTTDEEQLERAKDIASWADYYPLFSSRVNSALKHYYKKLIIILNDNEITAANDFLKNDLFENLRNAQNTLVALSPKDQEVVNSLQSKVLENRSMILNALTIYEYDTKTSRGIAAGELNNIGLPRVDREIKAISAAREYVQRLT
jgi:hypothetical protein